MRKLFSKGKNSLIVNLSGEVDQYMASELKGYIDVEIQSSPKRNIIINLEGVEMMDSSGIGLIVGRYKLVNSLGGKFGICNGCPSVKRMIVLSGITKVINYYDTIAEAEKSFGKQSH